MSSNYSEKVAKAMAALFAATWADIQRPSEVSTQIVDIAAKHLGAALEGYQLEIAALVGSSIVQIEREAE